MWCGSLARSRHSTPRGKNRYAGLNGVHRRLESLWMFASGLPHVALSWLSLWGLMWHQRPRNAIATPNTSWSNKRLPLFRMPGTICCRGSDPTLSYCGDVSYLAVAAIDIEFLTENGDLPLLKSDTTFLLLDVSLFNLQFSSAIRQS